MVVNECVIVITNKSSLDESPQKFYMIKFLNQYNFHLMFACLDMIS